MQGILELRSSADRTDTKFRALIPLPFVAESAADSWADSWADIHAGGSERIHLSTWQTKSAAYNCAMKSLKCLEVKRPCIAKIYVYIAALKKLNKD